MSTVFHSAGVPAAASSSAAATFPSGSALPPGAGLPGATALGFAYLRSERAGQLARQAIVLMDSGDAGGLRSKLEELRQHVDDSSARLALDVGPVAAPATRARDVRYVKRGRFRLAEPAPDHIKAAADAYADLVHAGVVVSEGGAA